MTTTLTAETVHSVACYLLQGIQADVFAFENDAYFYLVDQAESLTDAQRIALVRLILVGHHSEKRHRKDRTRIEQHFAKAKEHHDKVECYRWRAAAAECNVIIFGGDPDGTEKLVDKSERLKKRQVSVCHKISVSIFVRN